MSGDVEFFQKRLMKQKKELCSTLYGRTPCHSILFAPSDHNFFFDSGRR